MIVFFDKQYLEELYTKGTTKDKHHRYQPDIVRRYQKAINFMKNSSSMRELAKIRSLNLETLHGDRNGLNSVRVNDKYRIEFKVEENDEEPVMTLCNIIELTNHYK